VGIVGGGQLARMLCESASALGVRTVVLAEEPGAPAADVAAAVRIGAPTSQEALHALARECDVITFDHEQVDLAVLDAVTAVGAVVRPGTAALALTVDKARMRTRLREEGIPVPAFDMVPAGGDHGVATVAAMGADHGWPVVLKACRGGYDGKGVWEASDLARATEILDRAGSEGISLLVEERVAITSELAVLVARRPGGATVVWPATETIQMAGICRETRVPGSLHPDLAARATELGRRVAAVSGVVGVLAVELFAVGDDLVVNELAARPHNSGHWTIEGAVTSQFENHLRAVLDLPLGSADAVHRHVVMVNVLGAEGSDPRRHLAEGLSIPDARAHLYGKAPRPGRKLGHVTVCGDDAEQVRHDAWTAATALGNPPRTMTERSAMRATSTSPTDVPVVAVVMGSSSDLEVMRPAAQALAEMGVPHCVRVLSAHRTPHDMLAFGSGAAAAGLRVIIAGAGGAAHLPGMLAAATTLPVIGVPVALSTLDGLDSLLSIVQMPRGVPVATVAVNGGRNAGLLAVRMLALSDPVLAERLDGLAVALAEEARVQDRRVRGTEDGAEE